MDFFKTVKNKQRRKLIFSSNMRNNAEKPAFTINKNHIELRQWLHD